MQWSRIGHRTDIVRGKRVREKDNKRIGGRERRGRHLGLRCGEKRDITVEA
jgi:hypothetical protein